MHGDSFGFALAQWLALHSLGRKPSSVKFNTEIHGIMIRLWPGALNAAVATISLHQLAQPAHGGAGGDLNCWPS